MKEIIDVTKELKQMKNRIFDMDEQERTKAMERLFDIQLNQIDRIIETQRMNIDATNLMHDSYIDLQITNKALNDFISEMGLEKQLKHFLRSEGLI